MSERRGGRGEKVLSADRAAVLEAVLEAMARGETVEAASRAQGCAGGTVRQWFAGHEEWRVRYREARLLQGQAMAEEAVRIARDATNYSTPADKLLIETLKWAASKANPAEYGEKQTVEHQGQQTLQVKIVEEGEAPARTIRDGQALQALQALDVRAVEAALEQAVLVDEGMMVLLPNKKH